MPPDSGAEQTSPRGIQALEPAGEVWFSPVSLLWIRVMAPCEMVSSTARVAMVKPSAVLVTVEVVLGFFTAARCASAGLAIESAAAVTRTQVAASERRTEQSFMVHLAVRIAEAGEAKARDGRSEQGIRPARLLVYRRAVLAR